MMRLNIHEAKTHLSRYLDRIAKGESIILCRRNQPIRVIGLDKGKFTVGKEFFDPLPDDFLAYFDEGKC